MLTDLSGDIGVILFTNTSLGEQEMGKYNAIFKTLWQHAEKLQSERQAAAAH